MNTTTMKVFEFAKEVGLAPLALMDKIRDWGLPIKSHMADLTPEQISELKKRLGMEKESDSVKQDKGVKKTVRKKKMETHQQTVVVVKSSKGSSKLVEDEEKESETEKPSISSTKIVRRKKEDLSVKSQVLTETAKELDHVEPSKSDQLNQELLENVQSKEPSLSNADQVSTLMSSESIPEDEKTLKVTLEPQKIIQEEKIEAESKTAGGSFRKKEVIIGQSGVASQPSAVTTSPPRRNIVGRMDLSRVKGMTDSANLEKGSGFKAGAAREGELIKNKPSSVGLKSKTNLRAGFVVAPQVIVSHSTDMEDEKKKT